MPTQCRFTVFRHPVKGFYLCYLLLMLHLLAFGTVAQQIPEELPESTKRTEGGNYEEFDRLLTPIDRVAANLIPNSLANANLITNGGFETGNFFGWTVSPNGNQGWYPWQVTPANGGDGVTGQVQRSSPLSGTYSAWNGFCCNSNPNPEFIYQDVTIPRSQNAVLKWSERIQSDLATFCSPPACGSNIFRVEVLNPVNSAVLQTLLTITAPGGVVTNTGWVTHTANLSAYGGQTVRIRFSTNYTSLIAGHYNGPGRAELDGISLTTTPSFVYMRSSVGSPWGLTTNEAAMNAEFGSGNWHDLRYENASAVDIFSPDIALVFMEGGDSNASEMETFLNSNQALVENWVAHGGRLFLNSAPNEGNGMLLGFGGVTLNFANTYFTASSVGSAAPGQSTHPIFTGPNAPVGTSFSGGFFSHASITCGNCDALITGTANQIGGTVTILTEKTFGSGRVLFGGMTTTNFHAPQPHATNLRRNILHYLLNSSVNTNDAPSATADSFFTDEDTPLNVPSAGVLSNDIDADGDMLAAQLVTGPLNAQSFLLNSDGSFAYSPNANFYGTDSFTYKANDGQADSNVVTVTITVKSVNDAPMLSGVPGSATINELSLYAFGSSASDVDMPADTLTFSLGGTPPAGAAINPSTGAFSWTPTEAQGDGSNYSFQVCVSDGTAPVCAPISITVNEVNSAPQVANVPASASIDELAAYGFTATGSDADLPAQVLTFSLIGAPAGAVIDPSTGAFGWTPTEAQGPGSYNITVRISDGTSNADAAMCITVKEVNSAPALSAVANQTLDEGTALTGLAAAATDGDTPVNTLTYSIDPGYPAGMSIDPATGSVAWTPTEAQGPGDYSVTVRVTDDGTPGLSDTKTFSVHVNEVNVAPELALIGNSTIDEQVLFGFNAAATDADQPVNNLAYSLVGAPSGATITAGGTFSWTPDETQGPGSYTFAVKVTDDGSPAMSDKETITITVLEVNRPPVLGAIANQSGYWGNVFAFAAMANDPDMPTNTLTFGLIGAPLGASINSSTGTFGWTPTAGQVGSHTFTVRVTDNGTPSLYAERTVTINVGRRPTALVYSGDLNEQYSDQTALSATLVDNGGGAMQGLPLVGKTIAFDLGSQGSSGSTNAAGFASAGLVVTQDPAPAYTVDSSFAGDPGYLPATDSDAFDIKQEDARVYYTGALFSSTVCATCSTATVTLSATIKDITAESGDPAYDAYAGDIRKARVTFVNRDTNAVIASNVPVGLVSDGDTKVGTATFNWNVNIGSADSADYTVGIVVTDYYSRNAGTDDTLLTVSKPLGSNFITGGAIW